MERVHGNAGVSLLECINARLGRWRVRWDVQPATDPATGESAGVTFLETEFAHKPTPTEIRAAVTAGHNAAIDEQIKSGYTWDGTPVWLSTENQFNYKAAYDLAVQTKGASLPVTFKFGTDAEPVYHEFTTLAELREFYKGAMAWVTQCLAEGWTEKDSIDWSAYEV